MLASVIALGTGAVMVWAGLTGRSTTPVGSGPVFILAGLSLVAGLLDLRVVLRKRLSAGETHPSSSMAYVLRLFIATGSFFLGQQKVMPHAVRGSPILFVLAFAPLAVMLFWLVRIHFGKTLRKLTLRLPSALPAVALTPPLEMEI